LMMVKSFFKRWIRALKFSMRQYSPFHPKKPKNILYIPYTL
jgi:hypothetical protein